jgi:hypothetical protein
MRTEGGRDGGNCSVPRSRAVAIDVYLLFEHAVLM